MHLAYLSLGSNLCDKETNLRLAIEEIQKEIGEVSKISSTYETEAWGGLEQGNYLNLILEVFTPILPFDLISKILIIENRLGRIRQKKWDSRLIDIDIIFYENYMITTESLTVPHPYLEKRNFVLEPLNELIPEFTHPRLRKSISQLLAECPDSSWIKKL